MKEIIELTFEDIEFRKFSEFFNKIAMSSTLLNFSSTSEMISEDVTLADFEKLLNDISECPEGSFYFNLVDVGFDNSKFSKIGLQLLKYNDKFDLCFQFEQEEIYKSISFINFQAWSKMVGAEINAKEYFCGYEPSNDEGTQFFSRKKNGPLKGW